MIVVDTNILAFLFIQGDHSASVEGLSKKDSNWVAPTLWKDEFINTLSTYERMGELEYADCLELIEQADELMHDKSFQLPSHRVLAVAHRHSVHGSDLFLFYFSMSSVIFFLGPAHSLIYLEFSAKRAVKCILMIRQTD